MTSTETNIKPEVLSALSQVNRAYFREHIRAMAPPLHRQVQLAMNPMPTLRERQQELSVALGNVKNERAASLLELSLQAQNDEEAEQYLSEAERHYTLATVSPASRFRAGFAETTAMFAGGFIRGIASITNSESLRYLAAGYEEAQSYYAKRAVGTAGTSGAIAGYAPPVVAAILSGGTTLKLSAPLVAELGAIFTTEYGRSLLESDRFEVDNDVEVPWATKQAVAVGSGAIGLAARIIGQGRIVKAIGLSQTSKIGTAIQKGEFSKVRSLMARELGLNAAESAAIGSAIMIGYNAIRGFVDPEQKPFENVGIAALVGAAVTSFVGAGSLATWLRPSKRYTKIKNLAIKEGLLDPAEVQIVGDDPQKVLTIINERYLGNLVKLEQIDGKYEVISEPDIVPTYVKRAVGFKNESVLETLRKSAREHPEGPDAFFDRLFVFDVAEPTDEAIKRAIDGAHKLVKSIEANLEKGLDISERGLPQTYRAIVARDINHLVTKLTTSDDRRTNTARLMAYMDWVKERGLDKSKVVVGEITNAQMHSELPVLPYNYRPALKIALDPKSDTTFLRDASELVDDPTHVVRVQKLQKKLLEDVSILSDPRNRLHPIERILTYRVLLAEFNQKVDFLISKDIDSPRAAKIRALKHLLPENKQKLEEVLKPIAVTPLNLHQKLELADRLEKLVKEITESTENLTYRETIVALKNIVPKDDKVLMALVHALPEKLPERSMIGFRLSLAHETRLRLDDLKEHLNNLEYVNKERSEINNYIRGAFRHDMDNPRVLNFLANLNSMKTREDVDRAISSILELHDEVANDVVRSRVNRALAELAKNPKKDEIFVMLRDLGQAHGVQLVGLTETGTPKPLKKEITNLLKTLPIEDRLDISLSLLSLAHRGIGERRLYRYTLNWNLEGESAMLNEFLLTKPARTQLQTRFDTPTSVAKTVYDPVSIHGRVLQFVNSDKSNILYHRTMAEIERSRSEAEVVMARGRHYTRNIAKTIYGFDLEKQTDQLKWVKYLDETLPSGMSRKALMWAYGLFTDVGRRKFLRDYGATEYGKHFDWEKIKVGLKALSKNDRRFVLELKKYFENNPDVEYVFKTYTVLNGYDPIRVPKGWIFSRRAPFEDRTFTDFTEFQDSVATELGILKPRVPKHNAPFILDGGIMSAFETINDQLAIYGRMGRELYMAETLLSRNRDKIVGVFGEKNFDKLREFLANARGTLRGKQSAVDAAFEILRTFYAIGRLALNVGSALKQTLGTVSVFADDVVSRESYISALSRGAVFDPKIDERMFKVSGFAYQRFTTPWVREVLRLSAARRGTPTWLSYVQDRLMFMQRFLDKGTFRAAFRAAELDADKRGLVGVERENFIRDTFDRAMWRTQSSAHPLAMTDIELEAVKHPSLGLAVVFLRELNRIYNINREHVVTAIQKPTLQNVEKAAISLLTLGITSAFLESQIDATRSYVLGRPLDNAKEVSHRMIRNLVSRWYLLSDVSEAVIQAWTGRERDRARDKLLNPLSDLLLNITELAWNAADYLEAVKANPDEQEYRSGRFRGYKKTAVITRRAMDNVAAILSTTTGLPFWSVWVQGKGLYTWTEDDIRMQFVFERAYEKYRKDPGRYHKELKLIEIARENINKIHERRRLGLLKDELARALIARELKIAVGE